MIRVERPQAANSERDPRVSWFVWIGAPDAAIPQIAVRYVLRFSQEHGYRFDKQALLWDKPRLRTPAQFERWTHLVAIAHNQLVLARDVVAPDLRPWENTQRIPTPQQVRRGMLKLLPTLGTPARPPHRRQVKRMSLAENEEAMNSEMASQAGRTTSFCSMLSADMKHEIVGSSVPPTGDKTAWKAISLQSSSFLNLTPMGRLLAHHNPAENHRVGQKGPRSARRSGFRSCARRQNGPNWSQNRNLTRCIIARSSFHGTPEGVLQDCR